MNKHDEYQLYSKIYSKFYPEHVDIAFFNRIWQPTWKHVLEVGVGQGRLIPYFTSHPIEQFIGLDISEEMIARIPSTYLSSGLAQCACCDFLTYESELKFDFIGYTYNTFNYMLTLEEAHKHLVQCSRSLTTDGVIFFDLTFPPCLRNGIGSEAETRTVEGDQEYVLRTNHSYQIQESREYRTFQCDIFDKGQKMNTLQWDSYRRYYTIEDMISLGRMVGLAPVHLEMYLSEDKSYYDGYFLLLKKNPF